MNNDAVLADLLNHALRFGDERLITLWCRATSAYPPIRDQARADLRREGWALS